MSFSMRCGQADSFLFHDYHLYCLSSSWRPVLTPYSFSQQQFLAKNQKEIDPPPHTPFYFPSDDLFTVYCSSTTALVCMLGTLTALWGWSWIIHFFSPSPSFILFFLNFAGRMCACLSLCVNLVSVSLPLSLYFIILRQLQSSALTAWCEPNDSSLEQSLKQERAGNNHLLPLCSVVYCLLFSSLTP